MVYLDQEFEEEMDGEDNIYPESPLCQEKELNSELELACSVKMETESSESAEAASSEINTDEGDQQVAVVRDPSRAGIESIKWLKILSSSKVYRSLTNRLKQSFGFMTSFLHSTKRHSPTSVLFSQRAVVSADRKTLAMLAVRP